MRRDGAGWGFASPPGMGEKSLGAEHFMEEKFKKIFEEGNV